MIQNRERKKKAKKEKEEDCEEEIRQPIEHTPKGLCAPSVCDFISQPATHSESYIDSFHEENKLKKAQILTLNI